MIALLTEDHVCSFSMTTVTQPHPAARLGLPGGHRACLPCLRSCPAVGWARQFASAYAGIIAAAICLVKLHGPLVSSASRHAVSMSRRDAIAPVRCHATLPGWRGPTVHSE